MALPQLLDNLSAPPYGYSGQISPEAAIADQALNRRRLLATLLTQQGLQPQQGRMVGRFFVGPSPVQGGAGLAQVLAGGLGNMAIDKQQRDILERDQQIPKDFVENFYKSKRDELARAMSGPAPTAAPSQVAETAAPAQAPPTAPLPLPEGSDLNFYKSKRDELARAMSGPAPTAAPSQVAETAAPAQAPPTAPLPLPEGPPDMGPPL